MASKTFNWDGIWMKIFKLIPSPTTDNRLMVVLDDSVEVLTMLRKRSL
ncbi:MAG: hypothetical protein ACI8TE_000964 [Francisella sp.]|jgi:hypothetical protein